MGKSKPRTRDRAKNRDNPAGKPVKPPSDPELAQIRDQRILPILRDLQSAELKTRSAAARVISNIVEDAKCRKLLLREQIVRILFEQTLTDSNIETRTAGWGILRNLALEEDADFCIHLYRQDVLTAIEGVVKTVRGPSNPTKSCCANYEKIIQTISSQDPPFSQVPKAEQTLVWSLTGSIVNLLASLSEAQEEIVEAISRISSIVHFLFGLLSYDLAPTEVQNEALSCLTALTEDNKPLVQKIVENKEWIKRLVQIKDAHDLNAVAACGVLHNIFTCMEWFDHNTEEGLSDAILIPTLVKALSGASAENDIADNDASVSNPDQILRLALEITASIATSLQEALQHGTQYEKEFEGFNDNIEVDSDEDRMEDDEEPEEGEDEGDGEMNQDEIDADMDLVTGAGQDGAESPAEELTLDRLVRNAAPQVLQLIRSSPQTSGESESIKNHALSALNNIAWTVSSIDFSTGHLNDLKTFWSTLAHSIWVEAISPVLDSNTADIDLASSITSLAWAVSRSVQGASIIRPDEHRKFMALYQASKNLHSAELQSNGNKKPSDDTSDAFQSMGVKSIGVLGSVALNPAPIEINREIGIFLLTVVTALPGTQPAEAVEALNQIFDIYADKSYAFDEPVFWGAEFYKHLEETLPKVKKMAKTIDKRKYSELRSRADEAVLNLERFLKYKKTERYAD
jgi:hypothetical protein